MLHVPAGGESRFLSGARSPPLATAPPGVEIPQARFALKPGDTVLLYTDGLVERRDEGLDDRLEQLRVALAEAPQELPAALEHLTATLGGDVALRQDDVALLALRVTPLATESFAVTIQPVAEQLSALRGGLRAWLTSTGATASEAGEVLIAVGEACANAIEHAGAPPGAPIDVRGQLAGREVVLRVRDHGIWRSAQPRSERGQELRLMRVLMDDIDISSASDGTRVELRRRLSSQAAGADPGRPVPLAGTGATLAFSRECGVTVARLQGDVDVAGIADLERALLAAAGDGDHGLVLDLAGVAYLDSAGLHLLHDTARAFRARGQALRLVAAPGSTVLRLLELVNIEQTVALDPSVAAAVEALTPPPPL